jgi:uncharacterized iron-regulated membrane protein
MRTIHRVVSLFVVLFTLYLGVTGTLIQSIDLRTLFRHAPATDPEMMAIREDHDGPGVYAVISTGDYTAATLSPQFDYGAALPRLLEATRAAFGDATLSSIEFRSSTRGPMGRALSDDRLLSYDFTTGDVRIAPPPPHEGEPRDSLRNQVKGIHRMTTYGDWALWINPLVGIALGVFIVTGLVMYFQLLAVRSRIGRRHWFWSAGGWWRTLHRWISVIIAAFMLVVACSGTWLAYESLYFGYYMEHHRPQPGQPIRREFPLSPLDAARLPALLAITLQSTHSTLSGEPLKVLHLRTYGGMSQGVVIAGLGDDTRQVVFNAVTGRRVSETEPGYPETGFPFGWQAHQIAKGIHRGDVIGLSGRWMDLLCGLALIFFSISGAVMYYDMWKRRRRSGRHALLWT